MGKELSEMNLKELWQLFPIFLTEHNIIWSKWFKVEKSRLQIILPYSKTMRISHIGSTAVDTIWAKPIIDILVEIPLDCSMEKIKEVLTLNGYICMSQSKNRISFNKGYTKNGFDEKVYHLHLRYYGDNDELYFRDYLINNEIIAYEYEKLKFDLWKQYEYDRDLYTNGKTEFVYKYTEEAKEIYKGKY